jgi:hypothetical protein
LRRPVDGSQQETHPAPDELLQLAGAHRWIGAIVDDLQRNANALPIQEQAAVRILALDGKLVAVPHPEARLGLRSCERQRATDPDLLRLR